MKIALAALAVVALLSPAAHAGSLVERGWADYELGKTTAALESFREATRRAPDDVSAREAYQLAMTNTGRYPQMRDEARRALKRSPTALNYYLAARAEDDVARAQAVLEEGLARHPDDARLLAMRSLMQGSQMLERGKYDASLARIEQAKKTLPFFYHLEASAAWLAKADPVKAADEANRAVALEPHDPSGYVANANAQCWAADFDACLGALKEAVAVARTADTVTGLAVVLGQMGEAAQARALFREAVRLPPDGPDWAGNMSVARLNLNDITAAESYARQALRLNPLSIGAGALLVDLDLERHEFDAAESRARALMAQDPLNESAVLAMTEVDLWRGRAADAAAVVTPAMARHPKGVELALEAGTVAVYNHNCDLAQKAFLGVQHLLPNSLEVKRAMGGCALAQGSYSEAGQDFADVLDGLPDDYQSWEGLSMAEARGGYYPEALAALDNAIRFARVEPEKRRLLDEKQELLFAAKSTVKPFPRDASRAEVALTPVERLDVPYLLAYNDGMRIAVGRPSESFELFRATAVLSRQQPPVWRADGGAVYVLADGIDELDLAEKRSRRLVQAPFTIPVLTSTAPAELAKLTAAMSASYESLALAPGRDELYYATERFSTVPVTTEVDAFDLSSGKSRMVAPPDTATFELVGDVPERAILALNWRGPSRRIDPASGSISSGPALGECAASASLSADGRELACVQDNAAPDAELRTMDVDTGQTRFLGVTGRLPAWSPDGKSIAYVYRDCSLRLLDPVSGHVEELRTPFERDLASPRAMRRESGGVAWSPDSRYVLWTTGPVRERGTSKEGKERTFIADLKERRVWSTSEAYGGYAWAPVPYSR